jgi:hypothetical protein
MSSRLETYKKQAKQLIRWHRDGNHSIGGRIRGPAAFGEAVLISLPFVNAPPSQSARMTPPPTSGSWAFARTPVPTDNPCHRKSR